MKLLSKFACSVLAIAFLAGPALAADAIATGKVKSLNVEKKTFVLQGLDNKDYTFTLGDKLTINRGGKDAPNSLKEGDMIHVCYDKGITTWTANYILVPEGDHKNCSLMRVTFKSYDPAKKQCVVLDTVENKEWTFPVDGAKVRVNGAEAAASSIKIGQDAIAIVDRPPGQGAPSLKALLAWGK